jgi:DNA replication initiation complex subunit (GINS family)
VDNKTYKQLENEISELYADVAQYRRALIFVVKQMTTEQRIELLKSCKPSIYGAMLGAILVTKIPQKQ